MSAGNGRQFSLLRYGQCWEDADLLLDGLDVNPGHVCVSIASAGDNALSLLASDPALVIAVDISAPQLAALELRVAACRELDYEEVLSLIGSRPHDDRLHLYRRCRNLLTPPARQFWDTRSADIETGIGDAGKFERYFRIFRRSVLPMVHSRGTIERLIEPKSREQRERFFRDRWDNRRWRVMFQLFFSRFVMGRLGRDPSFFKYVEGSVSDRLMERARHALTELDPAENPYLQWILFGRHVTALPHWLRPDNFNRIRRNLDRLEWHQAPIEEFIRSRGRASVDRFSLSDVFEYMPMNEYIGLLTAIARAGNSGARIAYWNMLAPRSRPEALSGLVEPRPEASALLARDKAFFYSAFVVEEVQ